MTHPEETSERTILVYSRPGCHLCEQLVEELLPLIRDRLELQILNIDTCPEWTNEYGTRIPVVEYDSQFVCQYTLDKSLITEILAGLAHS
jgi:hypothetical protein